MTVLHQRRQFRSGTGGAEGLLREVNPGPLAPEARIMPLDQAANEPMPWDIEYLCVMTGNWWRQSFPMLLGLSPSFFSAARGLYGQDRPWTWLWDEVRSAVLPPFSSTPSTPSPPPKPHLPRPLLPFVQHKTPAPCCQKKMCHRLLTRRQGLLRELNPGPLALEARIMPLDQAAITALSGSCVEWKVAPMACLALPA